MPTEQPGRAGDREGDRRSSMIAVLERTPSRVSELVSGQSDDAIVRKPSPSVFSMRENIHHLRDIDVEGFAVRLGRILESDLPILPGIDGDRLAAERRYNDRPHDQALDELFESRRRAVARLRQLPPESWSREGRLEGVGTVTLERLVAMWCEHDASHIADLERLRTFLRAGESL